MRVLITSVSAYGHFQPMIPLAKALAEAGHEVAIATGSDLRSRAEAAGFQVFDAGLDFEAAYERLAARYPDREYNRLEPDEILGWYLPHLFGEIVAPAMLSDLEPLVRSWRPHVILHDMGEFAGPIAATSAGIPSVCQMLGIHYDDRTLDSIAAAVAPLWKERGLGPDPAAGLYRHLCLDIMPTGLQPYESGRFRDVTRPLRPTAMPPLPGEQLPTWIEQRRDVPLIHMTLGTNVGTNTDMAVFRSGIDGLGDLEVEVLITSGRGKAPSSFGSLPANVHVEQYVPHSLLLPLCSALIYHGGAGTTFSALAQGLPLLVLPQGADQYIIGDLVQASGAGLCLTPRHVNAATIRQSVLALLYEPGFRANARRLQCEIAAMPGPDEAVRLIEEVSSRTR
ncbi:MAG TPA: nucleotide disphospho-sugar-binding domain-containing protein [Ktedonobacteraceae bacterium]|nr:nucleotide disphospho-sugar-binding domain-containing protein [Ktedonobacteraceae bacterium]